MKSLIKEVVFTAYGDWKIEAYAWSKELARRLNTTFMVLPSADGNANSDEFTHKLLRGDGYYFGHYNYAPIKTHLRSNRAELSSALVNYSAGSSGLIVLVVNSRAASSAYHADPARHIVLSIPDSIEKAPNDTEFTNILHQVSILNLPFDFFETEKQSWLSKWLHTLRALL